MRSGILLCLLVTQLLADPITVTILSQQTQATASTYPISCYDSEPFSASCHGSDPTVPGGFGEGSFASVGPLGNEWYLQVSAGVVGCCGFSSASAAVAGTAVITGGTGTGYLNVAFDENHHFGPGSGNISIDFNGQRSQYSSGEYYWGVFSFQFGQPFTWSISLSDATDNLDIEHSSTLWPLGARIYSTKPAECNVFPNDGLCSDPGFVATNAFSTIVPEPDTAWLLAAALVFPIGKAYRRKRQ